MIRDSLSEIKNGKAAASSEETGIDMITDLVNQILVEGAMPADWELCTIVNCYKGKGYSLEKRKYRGVKLADQVLKILEKLLTR